MMCLKYSSNRSNTLKILLNHFKNRLGLVNKYIYVIHCWLCYRALQIVIYNFIGFLTSIFLIKSHLLPYCFTLLVMLSGAADCSRISFF